MFKFTWVHVEIIEGQSVHSTAQMGVRFWSIGSISAQEIGKTSVCVSKMLPFHGGSLHP